ncbi:O-antigen ligase family protein [Amorphus orientalis]|uniref:O-antigen ligase n=1 Tax=Amorphus orientalis TaxID=649198 RepID=A0AAE4AUQ6_9HYPH|nr:O-antigen ligase family protein [Amorphus orientalis]MDQ0316034.1 O-antigen ligase [Amorphus orientalis]
MFLRGCAAALLFLLIANELVGLDLFAPALSRSGTAAEGDTKRQIILLGLLAGALVLCVAKPRAALRTILRCWPIVLVLAWMTLSTLWSQFPALTIRRSLVYEIYFVIAIAAVIWLPAETFLKTLTAAFAAILVLNIVYTILFPGRAFTELGLSGIHLHKNIAGAVALVGIVLLAGYAAWARGPMRAAAVALAIAGVGFLLLTQSKNAIGFFFVIVVAVLPALVMMRAGRHSGALVFAAIAALGGLVLMVSGIFGWSFTQWIGLATGDATFTGRTDLWSAAIDYISESPLLGRGFGAHWSVPPEAHPLLDKRGWWSGLYELTIRYNQSHNGYLDIVVQMGAIGAALILIYLADLTLSLARLFALTPRTPRASAPVYTVATAILGILMMNLLESSLFFPSAPTGLVLLLLSVLVIEWQRRLVAARFGHRPAPSGRRPYL